MQELKRLLIVNWRDLKNPETGGAELHLHEVCRHLIASGIKCVLYAHTWPGAPEYENIEGLEVYRRGNRFLFNFTVWFCIRGWIRKHKPDLVIDDSNKVPFFLPWICSTPVVVRIHHLFGKVVFKETGFFTAMYVYCLERLGIAAWKKRPVITVSESTRRELSGFGIKNVRIAPNGVDHSRFASAQKYQKKKCTLTYVGRIKKYKRLNWIIEAVAGLKEQFPDLELIIAGSGDGLEGLQRLALNMGFADRVKFPGFVEEEDKVKLYAEATVVVNASLKEGWGLTVMEANACGTAVVATDVPGLRDSIRDRETGYLVPVGDMQEFRNKVSLLLQDEGLRKGMENAALNWAREHHWDKTGEITLRILKDSLKE
jgi:glycosyltransferase involved in cell wall biosynthesis